MSKVDSPQLYEQQLQISGMTCASCVARVEKALKKVEGVTDAQVNLATEKAWVKSQQPVAAATLLQAIEKTGFAVATQQLNLGIEGMTCASCVARVEKALKKVEGVTDARVNLATEQAQVIAL